MISHIVRELILPPSSLLGLLLAAWLLRDKKPRWGQTLFLLSLGLLYLLSIPLVSLWLSRTTERIPALNLEEIRRFEPQLVIALGGGASYDTVEFEGKTVPSASGLKRLHYAAYLGRSLELPILVTGGYGESKEDSEGYVAAQFLKQNGFEKVLVETESTNTRENAMYSKKIAEKHGLERVVVVTHASHAERALLNFQAAGFQVLAAPTGFRTRTPWERGLLLVIPSHSQFDASCEALRAHLGLLWARLRS